MTQTSIIGIAAGIIGFLAIVPYVRSILRGKTKPNRASWSIWVVLSFALLITFFFSGGGDAIWVSVGYAIFPLIVFALSIKHGVGGLAPLDIVCLVGALIGMLAWYVTKNPAVGLYCSIVVDIFGFIPTVRKAYLQPETEDTLAWGIAVFANTLNLFAITTWSAQTAIYPVYLLLAQVVVFVPLAWHSLQPKQQSTQAKQPTAQSK